MIKEARDEDAEMSTTHTLCTHFKSNMILICSYLIHSINDRCTTYIIGQRMPIMPIGVDRPSSGNVVLHKWIFSRLRLALELAVLSLVKFPDKSLMKYEWRRRDGNGICIGYHMVV